MASNIRRNMTVDEIESLYNVYFWVQGPIFIVLSTVGIITNILNIVTLSRFLNAAIIYKLFLGMACADLMHMISLISYSIKHGFDERSLPLDVPPHETVPLFLYHWFHSWFLFMSMSNWCSAFLVIFRCLAIFWPLKAHKLSSAYRVTIAIISVYVISVLAHLPSWISYMLDRLDIYLYTSTLSASVSLPIPLTVCFLGTIALVYKTKKQQTVINHMQCINSNQLLRREIQQRQLTITLILVVCYFMITNSILMLYFLMFTFRAFDRLEISHYKEHLFYLSCTAISLTSYATNFFIYILANKKFRRQLMCKKLDGSSIFSHPQAARLTSAISGSSGSTLK